MTKDEKYISRCLQLAHNGLCNTAPNPMVGAVIVYHDTIIGEGYHIRCGEAHAEVNAIRSVKDENLLKESTIYVSLEPCSPLWEDPSLRRSDYREENPQSRDRLHGPVFSGSRQRYRKTAQSRY